MLPVITGISLNLLIEMSITACSFSSEKINLNGSYGRNNNAEKALTLIVYMAADNDLESYALQNLKMMEQAEFRKTNVIVLLDRSEGYDETNGNWTDTRLFEVKHDRTNGSYIASKRISCAPLGLSVKEETELDMSNYMVLKKLIEFSKVEYPAEKYALIFWGHGTGWRAVAIDDKTQSYMCVKETGLALQNQGLSAIGFDTCFGAVFENLYELKSCADYTVASPGVTPSGGWNYKVLLEEVEKSGFTSAEIADCFSKSSSVGISLIDNSKLVSLMNAIENFSKNLSSFIQDSDSRENVLEALQEIKAYSYPQYKSDLYLDVYSMAQLYENTQNQLLKESARQLQTVLTDSVVTTKSEFAQIGIHLIPKNGARTMAHEHSLDYIKDSDNSSQCAFIKESRWWVPTRNGNSGSLLDKLFYTNF